ATWAAIEKRERSSLKQLKSIATIRSVGASTRIEGSAMSDEEVKVLIEKLAISKLEDRNSQEVAGYFEVLDLISEAYPDMEISEGTIKNLHKLLMRHSQKDEWHRGNYKQHSNAVEATRQDGSRQVIFETTLPGFATEDAMRVLIEWWHTDTETHPIVKCALFCYDFVSIHPFQDGNGRLSRLIATLLLLKNGYNWIQYVSFEHEIENRKSEYYQQLMQSQEQRPGEGVYNWVIFFLDCLNNISGQLMTKLSAQGSVANLGPKEKSVYLFIENHPGSQSGDIAEKLNIALPTVKKTLTALVQQRLIIKHGAGAGTNYSL
ncbi:MAG TPA: Fic family protein, partial [Flavitalea sp.]|nr:Fic family protein [Flavitalea sp.]